MDPIEIPLTTPLHRDAASRTSVKPIIKVRMRVRFLLAILGLVAVPPTTRAQTDEIQVYDAEIADPGVFNLMIHTNFTTLGRSAPDFPSAVIPNNSVNVSLEQRLADLGQTEQALQKAEEGRTRSEERFTRIFRSSPIAFSITTVADGRFVDVNDAFERRYGYCREQLIGRTVFDIGISADE